jgi:HEAT repeat protein
MSDTVIPFNTNGRLLAKARAYMSALDELIEDNCQAIDTLIKAYAVADPDLKLKIVLMLGTVGDSQVIWPLYRIMTDAAETETLRHAAAVQLSLVAGMVPDAATDGLAESLLADLAHPDATLRANAAFALGWEGNQRAVSALIDTLCDEDAEVQQAAVSALSNIRDDRLFTCLAERLMRGSKEQQRCILYHLCCFTSKQREVVRICTHYLSHVDADLRYDALIVLDAVSGEKKPLTLYLQCLKDADARIREQALLYMALADESRLKGLTSHIRPLLQDHSPGIRQAAVRLLHHICDGLTAVSSPLAN